jgi:hypothetical protein
MSVVRDPDAAWIDVERAADLACPLQVRMAAGEQSSVAVLERCERLAPELG